MIGDDFFYLRACLVSSLIHEIACSISYKILSKIMDNGRSPKNMNVPTLNNQSYNFENWCTTFDNFHHFIWAYLLSNKS